MDWPAIRKPFLTETFLGKFKYEKDPEFKSKALQLTADDIPDDNRDAVIAEDIPDDNVLTKWLSKPQDPSGFSVQLILSGRVVPVQIGSTPVPANLSYLPFSAEGWKLITSKFHLHNAIVKATVQSNSYCAHVVKRNHNGNETLEMYTAVTSRESPHAIAISSTYFHSLKQSMAVIYGCDDEQMDRVVELLNDSTEVKSHPLLMVGVFAELQRDRLEELVENVIDQCDKVALELQTLNTLPDLEKEKSSTIQRINIALQECRLKTKTAEEELRGTLAQLHKMTERVQESINSLTPTEPEHWMCPELAESTRRFKHRFEEISVEYEAMAAKCRIASEDMTYTREVHMAELSRQEATASTHQAKVGRVIAFVAMLYLPTTAVATVFSMPVFEFHNRWVNLRFQPADANKDAASGNDGPSVSKEGQVLDAPVFSGYFWMYLALSIFLTAVTIIGRWWSTKENEKNAGSILHRLSPKSWGRSRPKAEGGDGNLNTIGIRYLISQSSPYRNRARTNGTGTDKTSTGGSTRVSGGSSTKTDRWYWLKVKWPWTWQILDKKSGSLLPEHESK